MFEKLGELNTSAYILLCVVIIYLAIIVILLLVEQRMRTKGSRIKKDLNREYRKSILDLEQTSRSPLELFEKINKLARSYFKDAFKAPDSLEYSELADFFNKLGKKDIERFCIDMVQLSYSGKHIEEQDIIQILEKLDEIILKNPIVFNGTERSLFQDFVDRIKDWL